MSLTFTKVHRFVLLGFGFKIVTYEVTLDASYVNGTGYSITAANVGQNSLWFLLAQADSGYVASWDRTNAKLKIRYADYDAGADGALIEVPNSHAGLATVKVQVLAFGR